MQDALTRLRALSVAGLSTVLKSEAFGLNAKKEFEQKILSVLKNAARATDVTTDSHAGDFEQSSEPWTAKRPDSDHRTKESAETDSVVPLTRHDRSSNEDRSQHQQAPRVRIEREIQQGIEPKQGVAESKRVAPGESGKVCSTGFTTAVDIEMSGIKGTAQQNSSATEQIRNLGASSRERRVPSSPLGRVLGFAGLGANLAYGAVQDTVVSLFRSEPARATTRMMNERNAEVLAAGLCRMRGAALKLGQMLSIQDEAVIPPYLQQALDRVRAGADYMPQNQLERVLVQELGSDWQMKFVEFDFVPMAAASIGQVHRAVLRDGTVVAMKIQYPGVANSIESDLDNLLTLMKVTDVLPKGLYIDTVVKVMRKELALECDYTYELQSQLRFKKLIEADDYCRGRFLVPDVFPELSTKQILTSEWARGMAIDKVQELSQRIRNEVGARLLHITMQELFAWRYMQTDPNWGNFLYNPDSEMITLIDFGAAKEFPKSFTDEYLRMVTACAERDRANVIACSQNLGFLTGDENRAMLDAHCEAGFIVGRPFAKAGLYDFSQHSKLTARVTELGTTMLKHRLCPPPEESYSLHRKLSGAFLCCIKLGSTIPSQRMLYDVLRQHERNVL